MGKVADAIKELHQTLPKGVELVAVSKFQPAESIREAYQAGQRNFGESRVAEFVEKASHLPDDIRWHFIGHLQTNKAKAIIGRTALIESVDSPKLLRLIDELSAKQGIVTNVLMQVHVAAEPTKYGWSEQELLEFFKEKQFATLKSTRLCGVMGMATNTNDIERIESDFMRIAAIRRRILEVAPDLEGFDIVSMGMSDDYPIAIKHGATHVRIGSKIFGERTTLNTNL